MGLCAGLCLRVGLCLHAGLCAGLGLLVGLCASLGFHAGLGAGLEGLGPCFRTGLEGLELCLGTSLSLEPGLCLEAGLGRGPCLRAGLKASVGADLRLKPRLETGLVQGHVSNCV